MDGRLALCTLAFTLVRASWCIDDNVRVTYSTRAARVPIVLRQLGQIAKADLQTKPEMENEVLVISVRNQPLHEVLSRIATVTSGEWRKEGNTFLLTASVGTRRNEETQELNTRIRLIRADLNSRLGMEAHQKAEIQNLLKARLAHKNRQDNQEYGRQLVDENAVTRMLSGIDLTPMAQMEDGNRIVYSTDPTPMQRGLSASAFQIVDSLVKDHNVFASSKSHSNDDRLSRMSKSQARTLLWILDRQSARIGPVAKILLSIQCESSGRQWTVQLQLFDPTGNVAYAISNIYGVEGSKAATWHDKQREAHLITFSKDSREILDYGRITKKVGKSKITVTTLSPEVLQKVRRPDIYDPLSFASSDLLLGYSKLTGKPLVADIPDDCFGTSTWFLQPGWDWNTTSVEADIRSGITITAIVDPVFTVLRPASPSKSRKARGNRIALANLMQAIAQKGVPSLEDMSAFAARSPDSGLEGAFSDYFLMFVPRPVQEAMLVDMHVDWNVLRLYGYLSPALKSKLAVGIKVPISEMNSNARDALARFVFGSSAHIAVTRVTGRRFVDLPDWAMELRDVFGRIDSLEDPTEVCSKGLSDNVFVDMSVNKEFLGLEVLPSGRISTAVMGPDELVNEQMNLDSGPKALKSAVPRNLRIGDQTTLDLRIHLTPNVTVKQRLADHRFSATPKIVDANHLPADFQKIVSDRIKAIEAQDHRAKRRTHADF